MALLALPGIVGFSGDALARNECGLDPNPKTSPVLINSDDKKAGKWTRTCTTDNYDKERNGAIWQMTRRQIHWNFLYDRGVSALLASETSRGRKSSNPGDIGRYDQMFKRDDGTWGFADRTFGENHKIRLPIRFKKVDCTSGSGKCFVAAVGGPHWQDPDGETLYWMLLDSEGKRAKDNDDTGAVIPDNRIYGWGSNSKYEFSESAYAHRFIQVPEYLSDPKNTPNDLRLSNTYGIEEQELVLDGITVQPKPPVLDESGNPRGNPKDEGSGILIPYAVRVMAGYGYGWNVPFTLTIKGGTVIEGWSTAAGRVFRNRAIEFNNLDIPAHSGALTVNILDGVVRGAIAVQPNARSPMATVRLGERARLEQIAGLPPYPEPGSSVERGWITMTGDNSSAILAQMYSDWGGARVDTPLNIRTTGERSHGINLLFDWSGSNRLRRLSQEAANDTDIGITLNQLIDLAAGDHTQSEYPDRIRSRIGAAEVLTRETILAALGDGGGTPNSRVRYFQERSQQNADSVKYAIQILKRDTATADSISDKEIEDAIRGYIDFFKSPRATRRHMVYIRYLGTSPDTGGRVIIDENAGLSAVNENTNAIEVRKSSDADYSLATILIGSEGDFDDLETCDGSDSDGDGEIDEGCDTEVDYDLDGNPDAIKTILSKVTVDKRIETFGMASHGILAQIKDGRRLDIDVTGGIFTTGARADAILVLATSDNPYRSTGRVRVTVTEGDTVSATGAGASGVHLSGDGEKTVEIWGTVRGNAAGVRLGGGQAAVVIGPKGRIRAASGVGIWAIDLDNLVIEIALMEGEGLAKGVLRAHPGLVRTANDVDEFSVSRSNGETLTFGEGAHHLKKPVLDGAFEVGLIPVPGGFRLVDYAPRSRVYEALPPVLLEMNGVPGRRACAAAPRDRYGLWACLTTEAGFRKPARSTSGAPYSYRWTGLSLGKDFSLDAGHTLGVSLHHRIGSADVRRGGDIGVTGTGIGLSYAWDADRFYANLGAAATLYLIDLESSTRGELRSAESGFGHAVDVEAGYRMNAGGATITPSAGLNFSSARAGGFTDRLGAKVSSLAGRSLKPRLGIEIGKPIGNSRLFGSLAVERELGAKARAVVGGTRLRSVARSTTYRLGGGMDFGIPRSGVAASARIGYATDGAGHEIRGSLALQF